MNGNVIRTITIRGTSEGLDKVTADLNKLASAQENVAVVSEQSAKRVLSLEDAWKRQTLKLDGAARAQANIARETKIADAALREGVATQAQHAQRLEQINQRYNLASTATKEFGNQTGLARHELINLGRQAQDVGVSLVSGQSPLMVLAQQGSQIADVFISSGKSVGSFFTQAIAWARPFVTSTAGIVTGIAAIGTAAVYAASQFVRASTTIEEALEKENRLLKEGKALIDQRTSAEARAQLNPKDLTEYEIKRNLLDVQRKLNEEARNALIRTAPRPNISGDIRGEFAGEAPLTPGQEKILDATAKLKAVQEAGLPAMKEYNAELGRIATAHPELAKTVDKMIELGRTGIELENAEMRLKAIGDALKGVATNAQMAAVGLGSVAQFQLNNRQAMEAAEATERQKQNVLLMAQAYPGMSIEAAKQLDAARGQLAVAQQTTGLGQINAQHQATINSLLLQGLAASEAIAIADAQRAVSLAQVNAEAERTLKTLKNENELIHATSAADADRIKSRQTYNELIEKGVSAENAHAVAAQQLTNATEQRVQANRQAADAAQAEYIAMKNAAIEADNLLRAMLSFVPTIAVALGSTEQLFKSKQGGYSQFNPAGYTFQLENWANTTSKMTVRPPNAGEIQAYTDQLNVSSAAAIQQSMEDAFRQLGTTGAMGSINRLIEVASPDQQASLIQQAINRIRGTEPAGLAREEMINTLNDKLEQLTKATADNTSATQSMTDVLSPYYSTDPRRTHLGFRAFAGGGIMTADGALPLRQYAGGGMATSPQVAVFGEGSTPEAYVPVPSGRIPVEMRGMPAANNNNQRPVRVTINIMGNADRGTVAALKATSFQQAQAMRRLTS